MAWGQVDLCGLDTSKLPVLTPQRMQELYPLVHSGDKAARDEFIQGNLRLVLSVIQRFSGRGENVDDLFQVGCIGLMKALDNFDVSQNVRFSTYAVPMVIGEIRRYLRDNNAIRVSRSMRDTAYKALRARDRLQTELSREPTVEEIAADMHIDRMDVVLALEAIQDPVSLFEPVCSDGSDATDAAGSACGSKRAAGSFVRSRCTATTTSSNGTGTGACGLCTNTSTAPTIAWSMTTDAICSASVSTSCTAGPSMTSTTCSASVA